MKDRKLERQRPVVRPGHLARRQSGRPRRARRGYLAFVTDGYVFIELPVKARADVKDARIVDLAGDGQQAIVLRYRRARQRRAARCWRRGASSATRRSGGSSPPRWARRRRRGVSTTRSSFVKRGRATDIVVDAGVASGVSAATWKESPADDMIPMMLPWAPEKDGRHARYQFSGDEYKRAQ